MPLFIEIRTLVRYVGRLRRRTVGIRDILRDPPWGFQAHGGSGAAEPPSKVRYACLGFRKDFVGILWGVIFPYLSKVSFNWLFIAVGLAAHRAQWAAAPGPMGSSGRTYWNPLRPLGLQWVRMGPLQSLIRCARPLTPDPWAKPSTAHLLALGFTLGSVWGPIRHQHANRKFVRLVFIKDCFFFIFL